jgi:hypothetical protein
MASRETRVRLLRDSSKRRTPRLKLPGESYSVIVLVIDLQLALTLDDENEQEHEQISAG